MARIVAIFVLALALPASGNARAGSTADPLCAPLRAFVKSVQPDETRSLEFHTSWGSNFKDEEAPALYAKRCHHDGYAPAKDVCAALMKHGAIEFSDTNLMRAAGCLSPETRFGAGVSIQGIAMSLAYGNENRGSAVTLEYLADPQVGGMMLRISADGY